MEASKMEALYSKLYDKYNKMKTKKFTELDELNRDQEVKFVNYVSATEELVEHLRNENERLQSRVDELRSEVASVRVSKDEQCAEYQKLWMEEGQKNKVFSEEIVRLQKLQHESTFGSKEDRNHRQPSTPGSTQITLRELYDSSNRRVTRSSKRRRYSGTETGAAAPHGSGQDDAIERESTKDLHTETLPSGALENVQQAYLPECCRRLIDKSGGDVNVEDASNCLFQALIEFLVGMKFSVSQSEGICVSAEHQSSGYTFSLTWVNKADGNEVELQYNVLSLGTLERVAPQWMKEVIRFSTSMCPIFFGRVSRVVKLFS
ncbi:uncharacterized protein LOC133788690 [Humulus lupulus]|uniref:uncharacterized protein LOC133788690 n=1 Tax=Humulus lupulus TaxID=3486 RepID=UPI002B40B5CF|nr:uncharacterized protein LOC133788690 [Humulus lupulus]XP_062082232.1 uncharacterized protein LOC133788690 [Humulus lupulus]